MIQSDRILLHLFLSCCMVWGKLPVVLETQVCLFCQKVKIIAYLIGPLYYTCPSKLDLSIMPLTLVLGCEAGKVIQGAEALGLPPLPPFSKLEDCRYYLQLDTCTLLPPPQFPVVKIAETNKKPVSSRVGSHVDLCHI